MIRIKLEPLVGTFAENKDAARKIRLERIVPALEKKERAVLDFEGVDSATQSFIHALISDLIRKYGIDVLDHIDFKDCSDVVRKMISMVVEYMQESM